MVVRTVTLCRPLSKVSACDKRGMLHYRVLSYHIDHKKMEELQKLKTATLASMFFAQCWKTAVFAC